MYPSIAREEDDDVDDIPDDGEAERDEHPWEEHCISIIEIVGSNVVFFVFGVGGWVAVIWDGCYGPGYGADCYSGEEDGEDTEEEFPDVGGVVGVDCGS